MSTQRTKGTVKINQVGHKRMAPGNSDIVHAGETSRSGGVKPSMSMASKYDHGHGPKEYSHFGKSTAKSGKSQSPKQTYIGLNGTKRGQ
jgi:hypothetical protein